MLYRALVENDRAGEQLGDRAPSADLKALMVRPEWVWHDVGTGGDDTTALNNAAAAAATSGATLVFGAGKTYKITSTFTIRCDTMDFGATISVSNNPDPAILIGQTTVTGVEEHDYWGFRHGHKV